MSDQNTVTKVSGVVPAHVTGEVSAPALEHSEQGFEKQLRFYFEHYAALFELELSDQQFKQLSQYLSLLIKWNRAYNLTAIRDPQDMLVKHLLDSLVIAKYIEVENIVDIGTGAGLPGIPLAIVYPHKQFSLLDSNGKKTRFLQQVKLELDLANVNVIHSRVEAYRDADFEAVLSRAFSSVGAMLEGCQHLCQPHGRFFAMKGAYPEQELKVLPELTAAAHDDAPYELVQSYLLQVPELEAQRHLIEIKIDHGVI